MYKIESCTRELREVKGYGKTLFTGVRIEGQWYNLAGDHRNLYNKTADLILDGKFARFAIPQNPPAPAQQPPPRPAPTPNDHTPKWPTREDASDAYIYYLKEIEAYVKDAYALVKAANCLVMLEAQGEINPVHRKVGW
jgi:hypothetical protein